MPRRSAAEAMETKDAIVARAVDVASIEGLEGVTLGRLAADLGMSKAGILNHFENKEALQVAAVARARRSFERDLGRAIAELPPGLDRLLELVDAWLEHPTRSGYPGGCFWAAVTTEFDDRPGPVRDLVLSTQAGWARALQQEIRAAVDAGDLPADIDVAQVTFELRAVGLGVNQELQLHRSSRAEARARRAVRRILGRPDLPLTRRARRRPNGAGPTP